MSAISKIFTAVRAVILIAKLVGTKPKVGPDIPPTPR